MRKKPNLELRLDGVAHYILHNPREHKGRWRELSGGRPVHLEIGCGKGRFAVGTAQKNPGIFLVAVEMEPGALVMAAEAAQAARLDNLLFMNMDAAFLEGCFEPRELSRIYLNFSDPWPRNKYRRLTHERFLGIYRRLLADDGDLLMKTDNAKLFDWSLEQFQQQSWRLDGVTRDLHGGGAAGEYHQIGGVVTEYEQRFSAQGVRINRLAAYPPDGGRELTVEIAEVRGGEQIAELCRLAERVWREHYTSIIGKAQVAYMLEKFQSEAAVAAQLEQGYRYRLLRVDGAATGYAAVKQEDDGRLFLSKLYVDKRRRGQGLARRLLDDCLSLYPDATAVYLTCNKHNEDALAAYKHMGFAVTDAVASDIGGGFVMDDFVMEMAL